MKNNKYIFGIGGSIAGAIIGYSIGWFVNVGLFYLLKLFGIKSFGGGGIIAYFAILFGWLPIILFYAFIIIGAIWGWKYGYRIGKKKDDAPGQDN